MPKRKGFMPNDFGLTFMLNQFNRGNKGGDRKLDYFMYGEIDLNYFSSSLFNDSLSIYNSSQPYFPLSQSGIMAGGLYLHSLNSNDKLLSFSEKIGLDLQQVKWKFSGLNSASGFFRELGADFDVPKEVSKFFVESIDLYSDNLDMSEYTADMVDEWTDYFTLPRTQGSFNAPPYTTFEYDRYLLGSSGVPTGRRLVLRSDFDKNAYKTEPTVYNSEYYPNRYFLNPYSLATSSNYHKHYTIRGLIGEWFTDSIMDSNQFYGVEPLTISKSTENGVTISNNVRRKMKPDVYTNSLTKYPYVYLDKYSTLYEDVGNRSTNRTSSANLLWLGVHKLVEQDPYANEPISSFITLMPIQRSMRILDFTIREFKIPNVSSLLRTYFDETEDVIEFQQNMQSLQILAGTLGLVVGSTIGLTLGPSGYLLAVNSLAATLNGFEKINLESSKQEDYGRQVSKGNYIPTELPSPGGYRGAVLGSANDSMSNRLVTSTRAKLETPDGSIIPNNPNPYLNIPINKMFDSFIDFAEYLFDNYGMNVLGADYSSYILNPMLTLKINGEPWMDTLHYNWDKLFKDKIKIYNQPVNP